MEQILLPTETTPPKTTQSTLIHPQVLGAVFRSITQFLQCTPFNVEIMENEMNFLAMDTGHIALFHFQIKIKETVQTPITFMVDFAPHAKLTRNILDEKMTWDFSDPKHWIIHQPNQTLSFPIDREGEHEEYNLESLTEIRQQWMRAEIARNELQTLRPLIPSHDFFMITLLDNGLRFGTEEFTKQLTSLHTFDIRDIPSGTMNMYATRYLKDLLNLFKGDKKTGNNTWITVQFGKDTPLYVGFEEKREISAWKFEAWIAPRAPHEEKEEEAEASDQEPAEEKATDGELIIESDPQEEGMEAEEKTDDTEGDPSEIDEGEEEEDQDDPMTSEDIEEEDESEEWTSEDADNAEEE